MKKILAAFLLIVLSMSACACDVKDGVETEEDESTLAETSSAPSLDGEDIPDYVEPKLSSYLQALRYLEEENIEAAYDIFLSIKDYRDVSEYLERFSFKYSAEIMWSPRSVSIIYHEYDEDGKQVLDFYRSTYSYAYEYDDNDNLIKVVYRRGDREEITTYQYDENNRPICQNNPDGSYAKLEYDGNGNIIRKIGSTGNNEEYTYDADGNCLTVVYTENGIIYLRRSYEYDLSGNCVKQLQEHHFTDGQSNSTATTTYKYDENGNLIKRSYYDTDSDSFSIYTAKYDENGLMTEEHLEKNIVKYNSYFYEYDLSGNRVKTTFTSHTQNYTTVSLFEYDGYGNFVKKI